MAEKTLTKPMVTPTPISTVPPSRPEPARNFGDLIQRMGAWSDECEKYLAACGWEKTGINSRGQAIWADPRARPGQKPEHLPAVLLPTQGGGNEVIKQWFGPPAPWSYVTEEAIEMQRTREKAGLTLAQQIEAKEQELVALKELAKALHDHH